VVWRGQREVRREKSVDSRKGKEGRGKRKEVGRKKKRRNLLAVERAFDPTPLRCGAQAAVGLPRCKRWV
jgi:hypothetical protein